MSRFFLSAVVVLAATAVASAQRQPGGTRPGAGGFGQQSLLTQVPSNKDLQTELKVTDEQKSKFKDVAAKQTDVQKKMADLRPATGGGRPDMTKMTEARAEMTKVNEEVTKVVTDVLTTDQKKRVKQLEVQRMAMRAFVDADVVKELKLTDEQKTKVKTITDEVAKEAGTGRPMAGGGRPMPGTAPDPAALAEAAKKRAEANAKGMEKVSAELTDDQKKTWKELTGEKFDVSKLNTFGRAAPMPKDQ